MYSGGFYNTDILRFLNDTPLGRMPVIGQAIGLATDQFEKKDAFLGESLGAYRHGGFGERDLFRDFVQNGERRGGLLNYDYASGNDKRRGLMGRTGLTRSDVAGLAGMMSSYGGTETAGGSSNYTGMVSMMQLQGFLGLGQQGAGLMTALRQGGSDMTENEAFTQTLASAIGSQLDRGRWGEAFTAMSRTAATLGAMGASAKDAIDIQKFAGLAGARFAGDTQSNASLTSMLESMKTGAGGGVANVLALQAAGLGSGATYSEALYKVQTGQVDLKTLIDRYRNFGAVKQYLNDPNERNLQQASVFLWHILGRQYRMGDIAGMLTSMANPRSRLDFTEAASTQLDDRYSGLPERERELMRSRVEKSLEGTGAGQAGDSGESGSDDKLRHNNNIRRATAASIRAARGDSTGAGTAAGRGALGDLSEADIARTAALAGVPASYVRSWFQIESGGRTDAIDAGGKVRGFGQWNREEAALVGVRGGDFDRLSSDKDFSLQKSAQLIKLFHGIGQSRAPHGWSEEDILHFTKLQHGGQGYSRDLLSRFMRSHHGASPSSWRELFDAEINDPGVTGSPGVGARGALLNADKIVVVVEDHTSGGVKAKVKAAGRKPAPGQLNGSMGMWGKK